MAAQDIAKHSCCLLICSQFLLKPYRARYKTYIMKDLELVIKTPP